MIHDPMETFLKQLACDLRSSGKRGTTLAALTLAAACGSATRGGMTGTGGSPGASGAQGGALHGGGSATGGLPNTEASGGDAVGRGGSDAIGGEGGARGGEGGARGGEGGEHGGEGGNGQHLQPYPTAGLGCFGPVHNDGYYGQCCYAASCYTPPNGEKCGDSADTSILPPGSGSCPCSENGQPEASGPYAPNPTHMPLEAGTCCYLIGSIECEGRPFFVDGELLLADVVARNDWGLRA